MAKILSDKEILTQFMKAVGLKAPGLAKAIGYSSNTSIYRVIDDGKDMPDGMVDRILAKFPNASALFLNTGRGEPLVVGTKVTKQHNVPPTPQEDNPFKAYLEIPARLDEIQEAQERIESKIDKLLSLYENK